MRTVLRALLMVVACQLLLLVTVQQAQAATCGSLTAGMNASQIQTALNACSAAGGGTVTAPPGTYPVTATVTLPCNVTLSGPVLPYSKTHYQTAIFQGSSSYSGLPIHTTAGCSASQSIEYLEWTGQQPTNGGGFIDIVPGTTNLVINNNYIHGSNAAAYAENTNEAGILLDGVTGSPLTQNVTITLNEFGGESLTDCGYPGGAMGETNTEGGGGFCAGVISQGQTKNVSITKNIFQNLEQGAKVIEASSGHGNTQLFTLNQNSFTGISRIDFETQSNIYDTSRPTFQNIQYNFLGNRYASGQFNFDLSIANGCGNPPATPNCTAHMDYNVDVQDLSTNRGGGNEFWGDSNSTGNYNLLEGYVAKAIGGGITWSQSGAFNFNNNTFNILSGGNTSCTTASSGYWSPETSNGPRSSPTCAGNTYSNVGSGTYASKTPTISPAGGTFSGVQTVTLACPACTNRDANTSIWYTTNGSAPVPGVANLYTAPFSIATTTTVKAIGMWGAINQPYSYPSGYGYLPSPLVSASFSSSSGVPTLTSITISCPSTALTAGDPSEQCSLACNYSSGPPQDCTNVTDVYGHGPGTYMSSQPTFFSVTSSAIVTPLSAGSGNLTASVGVLTSTLPISVSSGGGGGGGAAALGNNVENYTGITYSNAFNMVYAISPTYATTVGAGHFFLPTGTIGNGKHYDIVVTLATSTTAQSSSALCHATYTTSSTSAPNAWVATPSLSGCGTIPANTAYWVGGITDDPSAPAYGFWDCGTGGGNCTGSAPSTYGTGTYPSRWVSNTYGTYTGMTTALGVNNKQVSQYVDLIAVGPTLVSAYQDNTLSINRMVRGTTYTQHAYCVYSDFVILPCDTTDARGDVVTAWTENSSGTVLSIGAVGGGSPGLVTGLGYGQAKTNCTVTGPITCSTYVWTITNQPATARAIQGAKMSNVTTN